MLPVQANRTVTCLCCTGPKWSMVCQLTPEFGDGNRAATWDLVDTHTHAHQFPKESLSLAKSNDLDEVGVKGPMSTVAVLAVSEADWSSVLTFTGHENLALGDKTRSPESLLIHHKKDSSHVDAIAGSGTINPSPYLIPGLGIHPWYVQEASPGWEDRLRSLLLAHPTAIVGEIGLCKCAKNLRGPGSRDKYWPMQRSFLKTQLALANALARPASVHCVKAMGPLVALFKEIIQEAGQAASSDACLDGGSGGRSGGEDSFRAKGKDSFAVSSSSTPSPRGQTGWDATLGLPPCVALHSFSGTAHHIRELLGLETPVGAPGASLQRHGRRQGGCGGGGGGDGGGGASDDAPLSKRAAKRAAKAATKAHQKIADTPASSPALFFSSSSSSLSQLLSSKPDLQITGDSCSSLSPDSSSADDPSSSPPAPLQSASASHRSEASSLPRTSPVNEQLLEPKLPRNHTTEFYFGFSHTINVGMGFGSATLKQADDDNSNDETARDGGVPPQLPPPAPVSARAPVSALAPATKAPAATGSLGSPATPPPLPVPATTTAAEVVAETEAAAAAAGPARRTEGGGAAGEGGGENDSASPSVSTTKSEERSGRALQESEAATTAAAAAAVVVRNLSPEALRKKKALFDAIRAVPEDRLLLESDQTGSSESLDSSLKRCAAAMTRGVALIAEAKGWSCERVAALTAENGRRFLLRTSTAL